jgi:transposase
MISAVKSNTPFKFVAPLVFQGSCDRSVFTHWLEYLLESLKEANHGQVRKYLFILDNASIHKGKEIDALVAQHHSRIFYLPAYSPDFNPIEKAWSVLKNKVRYIVSQQNISVLSALEIAFKNM